MNARFKMIISMVIFGTIGLFVKNIPLTSAETAFFRAALAIVFISGYLLITKQKINIKQIKSMLPVLIVSGFAVAVNWVFLFEAYRYTSIATATLSYYFAPIIVMFLSPILFKEKLKRNQIICLVISMIGLILLLDLSSIQAGSNPLLGIFLGLLAALFYAAVIVLNKFIKGVSGMEKTLIQFMAATLILLPYVMLNGGFHIYELNHLGFMNLLIVGMIHTGIAYCLYFSSLSQLSASTSALLSYVDPGVAVLMSCFILHEPVSLMQFAGGLLILGCTYLSEK